MNESLLSLLNFFFRKLHFEVRDKKWFRKENDGFIVCQFQRFTFDNRQGFLNFGIVYNLDESLKVPKGEDTWDLRGRYKSLVGEPNNSDLFCLEITSEKDMKELELVLDKIEKIVIPYLVHYSKFSNLKSDLVSKHFDYSKAITRIQPHSDPNLFKGI